MSQHIFSSETAPSLANLDGNFTELYEGLWSSPLKVCFTADDRPTLVGTNVFGQTGSGGSYRLGVGMNVSWDGTNWRTGVDGNGANAGAAILTRYGTGTLEFHALASVGGGASQTIPNASMVPTMSLDYLGRLLVGTTAAGYRDEFALSLQSNDGYAVFNHAAGSPSGRWYLALGYAGAGIGGILQNGTTGVSYNTTSDYRLKHNPQPLTTSGAFIDALQPKAWTWAQDGSPGAGFIAHEFAQVSPTSVSGAKDAVDEHGAPVYQSMQASTAEVMANIVAELQSLRARLAAAGIA